jgi:hypothetical protein
MVQGHRSVFHGPRVADQGQTFEVQASRLPPLGRRTGVTRADCRVWIELARGVGARFGRCSRLGHWAGDGLVVPPTTGFFRASNGARALHKLPIWFIFVDCKF